MTCPESNKIKSYILGNLNQQEEKNFQEHLKDCRKCCSKVEEKLRDDTFVKQLKSVIKENHINNDTPNQDASNDSPFLSGPNKAILDLNFVPGQQLTERYRIIRKLDEGNTIVYHALDLELDIEVAIKIVAVRPDQTEKAFYQLRQELLLRNPIYDFTHIIKTYDIHRCEHEGLSLILLSMEYADGGSLKNWLEENKDNENKLLSEGPDLFEQTCLAVRTIHQAGLIHRDIKPENILLCRSGNGFIVKLSDFGISYSIVNFLAESRKLPIVAGTPLYMAPEQFVGRPKDIKASSDIYSLGVVLFEILDGSPPFYGTFEELRDKHLHDKPPKLSGKLSRWGRIVERCLKKEPSDRYLNVDELIRDIIHLKREFSLSTEIACPACDHINNDPKLLECEKCAKPLPKSLFRLCPWCHGQVRLDQEDCPHCAKKGVAAYYLLEERKKQIELLKDEDLAQAIKLLETVFREGAADYAKRAEELIFELRQKEQTISSLVLKAKRSTESGDLEKALKFWQQVLHLAPRHQVASERKNELQKAIDNLTLQTQETVELMDTAEFSEAEKLLQKCMEIAPNRKNIREMFEQCSQRANDFKKAYSQAYTFSEQKLIHSACDQIKKALKDAPKSLKAQSLSKELNGIIEKADDLIKKLNHQIRWAQFENASKTISSIETLQSDNKKIETLKRKFKETRDLYTAAITDVELAVESQDLSKASDNINKALELCPDSTEAKVLSDKIDIEKHTVEKLLGEIAALVAHAEFGEAENVLEKAKTIWITADGLVRKIKLLNDIRAKYNLHFTNTLEAKARKKLDVAEKEIMLVLSMCPDSVEARSILSLIEDEKQKANEVLKKLDSFVKSSDFSGAENVLNQAESIWKTIDGLDKRRASLKEVQDGYNLHLSKAREYKDTGDFGIATEETNAALLKCPESEEANGLFAIIKELQDKTLEYLNQARGFLASAKFDNAIEQAELGKGVWGTCPEIEAVIKEIYVTKDKYIEYLCATKKLLAKKLFEQASNSCKKAINLCPECLETRLLSYKITSESQRFQKRKENIKATLNTIYSIISFIVAAPFRGIIWVLPYIGRALKVGFEILVSVFTFIFLDHAKVTFIVFGILLGLAALAAVILGAIALFSTPAGIGVLVIGVLVGGALLSAMYGNR